MNNYTISKASSKDIDRIMVLAAASRQIMKESGNPTQWTDNHPSRETIEEDVERGDCYVISKRGEDDATDSADKGDATDNADSMIVGSFVFRDGPDPSYANIYDGAWIDDTLPYHVIHRVMSLPDAHGIFAEIINFCFQHSKNIRIDTHSNNRIMRRLIEKYGFKYCGIVHIVDLEEDYERRAYQSFEF